MTETAIDLREAEAGQSGAATIGLVGAGRLGEAIGAALGGRYDVVPVDEGDAAGGARGCALVLAVSDAWETDYEAVARTCREAAASWLPVRVELGQAVIGPLVRPGVPGCASCAESRRRGARSDRRHRAALHDRYRHRLATVRSSWLTDFAVDVVAALVATEVAGAHDAPARGVAVPLASARGGGATARTTGAVICVSLDTLATSVHRFLPDPLCATCGSVPRDTADEAVLTLRSRPKPSPDTYRIHHLADLSAVLLDTYVDAEAGVVSAVRPREAFGLPTADAPVGLRTSGFTEFGFGRTLDHRASGLCAVLEALERYGGFAPGRTRPDVWASYADVREHALDPRTLGLYESQRHRQAASGYQAFDERVELQWMWAYSFGRQESVLVPASIAYYGHTLGWLRGRPLTYETSNGCALGGCLEEAILYGVLEVAERDAFLMTWYARLPAPRIDLGSARDRRIPLLAERTTRASGYEILAFATTLEQGVPAVLVMAVHPETRTGQAKALCTAGAHLDPERACLGALAELVPMLSTTPAEYARQTDRIRAMVDNPDLVRVMSDHSLLYCDPAAFDRLDFLTRPRPQRTFAEAFTSPRIAGDDLRDDVTDLIGRYLSTGLDVIVVDQTTAEHRAGDLRCVKVIIPGMLPMTFGHFARRTDGLPRLLTVPHLLGHRDRPLSPTDVNPHPHPFP
jgi:ribosomal protein S12 methylthiotransferase accessory factor